MTALKRFMTTTSFLTLWLTMLLAMMGGIAAVTKTALGIGSKSHVGPQRMESHGFTHVVEGEEYLIGGSLYIGFRGRLVGVPAGGTNMTSSTMATWTPEVWSVKPTITYRSNLVAVPLLDHTWEPELGVGRGDLVNIPGFSQNNAARNRGAGTGSFGEGAAVTFDAVAESQIQLKVNRFYYKAFRQPVEAAAQIMPAYIPLLLGGQGQAIALQVDADIFADASDGFDTFTTIVGVDNVDITDDDLIELETNLSNVNAPVTDRFLAISPASRGSLLKIESIRNSLYAGTIGNIAGSMGPGFLGPVLTFQVYMTNNLEAGTSGTKNFGWHREAVAFAEQVSVRTERDLNIEDGVFQQYISYQTCGFKVIKSTFANELAGK